MDWPSDSSPLDLMNSRRPPLHTCGSTLFVTNQNEDRISILPDHILLDILERLDDVRTVTQVSTLSRQWAHLPRSLSCLRIHVAQFLPCDRSRRPHWRVDQVMTTYTAAVTSLLLPSPGAIIKHLQLSFYLKDPYLWSIGHAVGNAVESGNTSCLEFTILPDVRNPQYEDCLLLGERFMSFFQACPLAFRWLTRLILENITFGDSDIHNLLDTCNKLELLSLTSCDSGLDAVTREGAVLTIDAPPHSMLLALVVTTCMYERIHLVRAPKLQRLVCSNWIGANPPLCFVGNVPHLRCVALRRSALSWQTPFTLTQCLGNTKSLSVLCLNFYDQMIWIQPEGPKHLSPILGNLRDVHLYNVFDDCDLNWTMFVLEAAPSLNNFYLALSRHTCKRARSKDSAKRVNVRWDQSSPDLKHHRLSLLQIACFAVDEKLVKYIRLVMDRAVGLKRIRLLDRAPCAKCNAMDDARSTSSIRPRFPVEEEEKKLIRQQLVDGFSSSSVQISIG